jgi:hypothetical protein
MPYRRLGLTIGLASLVALAACSGKSTPAQADGELQRDLQLATGSGIELLPNAPRTAVVSAIEQAGTAVPAPSPTKVRAPRPKPRRVAPPARVVTRPAPTHPPSAGTRSRPEPRPSSPTFDANVISPPPPGGYKTVDEVIRNAPFPIKPVRN